MKNKKLKAGTLVGTKRKAEDSPHQNAAKKKRPLGRPPLIPTAATVSSGSGSQGGGGGGGKQSSDSGIATPVDKVRFAVVELIWSFSHDSLCH